MRTAVFVGAFAFSTAAYAAEPRFDPFSRNELATIVDLLVESGRTSASTRIARVTRLPGDKRAPPRRKARVVALLDGMTTEIDVDLETATLSFNEVSEGYAPITSNDWARANAALRADPRWVEAIAARGIEDTNDVFCESLSAGYFAGTPSAGARVIRLPCYEISEASTNIYGRPIEGLIATVDLATGEVIHILDEGATLVPPGAAQLPVAAGTDPKAPHPGIVINGHRVAFGPWSVHASLDDQFGLVLSDVSYVDGVLVKYVLESR